MQNPENFAVHVRLVELANIIINEKVEPELIESINNLIDKAGVGNTLKEIESEIEVAYEQGQLFDPETLDFLREKNKKDLEKAKEEIVEVKEEEEVVVVEVKEPKRSRKAEAEAVPVEAI